MKAETVHQVLLMGILIGLAFAIFAMIESTIPALQKACSVSQTISCSKIDDSAYTTTLGVKDYFWGIGGYIALLALDIPLYRTWKREWLLPLTALSGAGVLLSIYLGYVEIALIQGLCLICLGAYLSNVVVFACAAYLTRLGSGERRAGAPTGDAAP